jgi:hypothetical protein
MAINGRRGRKFKMGRAVHQRCPIASCLCLFVIDIMGYMISNPTSRIEG